jgi:hypothetical protein
MIDAHDKAMRWRDTESETLLAWLGLNGTNEHTLRGLLASKSPATGAWIYSHPVFSEWAARQGSKVLWLKGARMLIAMPMNLANTQ